MNEFKGVEGRSANRGPILKERKVLGGGGGGGWGGGGGVGSGVNG